MMKKLFISVPIKLLLLVVGALFLLSVIFSVVSFNRLNHEFEQYQSDTVNQGQAQFDIQNQVLQQQLRVWLESFADIVHLKDQQDFVLLAQNFSEQFDALQLNHNVENLWLVDSNLSPLFLSNEIPLHVKTSVQRVVEQQSPEYQLYCLTHCQQLITIPLLNKKGDMAIVVMSVSLVDMIYAINQALQSEVAIVSFKAAIETSISQANFLSSSNTAQVKKIFDSSEKLITINSTQSQTVEVEDQSHQYLVNLIPLTASEEQVYYLALVDDVTDFYLNYQDYRQQFLLSMLMLLIAIVIIVHFVASPFTKRLLVLSDVLPLLAKKEFDEFRKTKIKRNSTFVDELDILSDATTELSYELEQLNIEVEQKTKELENIAMYDLLTGLPNRNMLNYQLRKSVANLSRYEEKLAVLFLDLDDFKKVNDSHGHSEGDKLLIEASNRIRSSIRAVDVACRFGGDEFVIILGHLDSVEGAKVVAKEILEHFKAPIKLGSSLFYVSTSIGIAFTDDETIKAEALISYADIAMYEAKDNGGAQFHVYHSEMYQRVAHRVMMEGEVRQALKKNQFSLSLQPQIIAKTNKLYGFEALLRWQHPERGMIAPDDFIPILENSQHMIELGYWIIKRCFEICVDLINQGYDDIRIAINLSAGQFADPNLPAYLNQLLKDFEIGAQYFELELTEQTLVKDIDHAIDMMNTLKIIGFSFAIDDFGTGYSSLAYLKKMPVDVIKIDKSFIFGMLDNRADYQIIMSTISMVKNLELTVVAEGVETSAQLRSLTENHCDIIQGYYFSKPIPDIELYEFLDKKILEGRWKTSAQ
jgi:diguanylate cyclase (GGDEF)-like protein